MTGRIEVDLAVRAAALRRRAEQIPDYDRTEKQLVTRAAEDARLALVEGVRASVAAHNPQATRDQVDRLAEGAAARLLDDMYTAICTGRLR